MKIRLIEELKEHLSDMDVKWHLCGGYAIDYYLGKATRVHKDIDITVSFNDMKKCTEYLTSKGWKIDVPIGNGIFVDIDYVMENKDIYFDNIWCYKEGCDFIITENIEGVFKRLKYENREQTNLDFIEVIFNKIDDNKLYYDKNPAIVIDKDKAFIDKNGMSILAIEMILLHKSRNHKNLDYQSDYIKVIDKIEKYRYKWLKESMKIAYPNGHEWIDT